MRKLLIILMLCLTLICRVSATEKATDTITKIENSILGATYQDQKTETRLSRIEEYVYGSKRGGTSAERLKHLAKDLNADVIGQETEPTEDTLAQNDEYQSDSSVDYPVIEEVEKHLSIKSKPNQSLHSRIVTIEKRLFEKVFDTDDFYTRVERIKGRVYKNYDSALAQEDDDSEIEIPEYKADEMSDEWGIDRIKKKTSYPNMSMGDSSRISKLERKIFDDTFEDESNNERLARLENDMFDTEFYDEDERERINRLEGALKGQRSANRYDNNKLQQRINTALQIGAMILMVLACIL